MVSLDIGFQGGNPLPTDGLPYYQVVLIASTGVLFSFWSLKLNLLHSGWFSRNSVSLCVSFKALQEICSNLFMLQGQLIQLCQRLCASLISL